MSEHTDPINATSLEVKRRTFIGVTAVAAGAATIAPALGAGEDFGKAHPPIVPENDPDLKTEKPTLVRDDGNIDAYAAYPKNAGTSTPGVVLAMHIWGVDTNMRDVARRFAKAGYVAIVPDLYGRWNPPSGDGATDVKPFIDNFLPKLTDDQIDKDLAAGAAWIRSRVHAQPAQRPPKVGVLGFCMGGSMALRAAVDDAVFDAAAVFYGKVRYGISSGGPVTEMGLAYADEVRVPVVGSWGGRDTSILPDDVHALEKRLTVPHDFKIYDDAGHGFFDDQRAAYNAAAAQDAWARTLAWFARYLN